MGLLPLVYSACWWAPQVWACLPLLCTACWWELDLPTALHGCNITWPTQTTFEPGRAANTWLNLLVLDGLPSQGAQLKTSTLQAFLCCLLHACAVRFRQPI